MLGIPSFSIYNSLFMNLTHTYDAQALSEKDQNDCMRYVTALLATYSQFSTLVRQAFENHPLFVASLDKVRAYVISFLRLYVFVCDVCPFYFCRFTSNISTYVSEYECEFRCATILLNVCSW